MFYDLFSQYDSVTVQKTYLYSFLPFGVYFMKYPLYYS
jgi:hypothetical protein